MQSCAQFQRTSLQLNSHENNRATLKLTALFKAAFDGKGLQRWWTFHAATFASAPTWQRGIRIRIRIRHNITEWLHRLWPIGRAHCNAMYCRSCAMTTSQSVSPCCVRKRRAIVHWTACVNCVQFSEIQFLCRPFVSFSLLLPAASNFLFPLLTLCLISLFLVCTC